MILRARCLLSGEFKLPDGRVVGSLAIGDVFELDDKNARKLLSRRQVEQYEPPKAKAKRAKPKKG